MSDATPVPGTSPAPGLRPEPLPPTRGECGPGLGSRYPNSQGYQDHHLVPVYLGGPRSGVTYRIPTAYHKLLTREFRREWSYDRGEPSPQELQTVLLKVYSQYPIPQLIGITP